MKHQLIVAALVLGTTTLAAQQPTILRPRRALKP